MLVGEGITAAPYQKIDIWEPAKYKQTNILNNHALLNSCESSVTIQGRELCAHYKSLEKHLMKRVATHLDWQP